MLTLARANTHRGERKKWMLAYMQKLKGNCAPLKLRLDEFTMASERLSEAIVWFPATPPTPPPPSAVPPRNDPVPSLCVLVKEEDKWMFDWEQTPCSAFCTVRIYTLQSCSYATEHRTLSLVANNMQSSALNNWLISGKLGSCVV